LVIDGPRASVVAAVALLIAAAALYTSRLDRAPYYVSADEAHFAAHATSLADRGTDLHGNRFPIFFRITDPLIAGHDQRVWYQPLLFYVLAANFTIFPVNEIALRMPIALIGAVNVWLMFLVARLVVASRAMALLAASLLALTPAHFLFSRQAADYLLPLPFVLVWLWCALRYLENRSLRLVTGGAIVLGVGFFSYIASWVAMPLLALVTVIVARPPLRHAMIAGIAFLAPITITLLLQPDLNRVLGDLIGRYRLDTGIDLAGRVSLYWQYFNPSFLVFAGGADPLMATSRAGVFLIATAVLIGCGTYIVLVRPNRAGLLVLAGFMLAPLPVVLTVPETPSASPGRVMTLVVFGALLAAIAAERFWLSQRPAVKAMLVLLIVSVPVQFASFQRDYFGEYQHRASHRFDPYAMRDALAAVSSLDQQAAASAVLLADDGDTKGIRWRFYTLKERNEDLWQRTSYFDAGALGDHIPPDALLITGADDRRAINLLNGGYERVMQVRDRGGRAAADIYRRAARATHAIPAAASNATNGAAISNRD
jgi:4-amino-4-deoxy-L-arabinose transferase-like glycosyltransferase